MICGVNLPLFLELLGLREAGDLDLSTVMQTGKDGIRLWEVAQPQSDDDFFLKSDDYDKTEDLYFTKTLAEAGFFVVLGIGNQKSRSG